MKRIVVRSALKNFAVSSSAVLMFCALLYLAADLIFPSDTKTARSFGRAQLLRDDSLELGTFLIISLAAYWAIVALFARGKMSAVNLSNASLLLFCSFPIFYFVSRNLFGIDTYCDYLPHQPREISALGMAECPYSGLIVEWLRPVAFVSLIVSLLLRVLPRFLSRQLEK